MPETIRGITLKEIAQGVTITLGVYLLAVSVPILGFFFALMLPLPSLFYRVKLGRSWGSMVPAVSGAMIATVAGGVSADVVFSLELLLLGFVLGDLFGKNLSLEKTILYACAAVWGSVVAALMVYSRLSGSGIVDLISGYVLKNLEITLALYQSMDVPEESVQMLSNSLAGVQYVLVRMTPALVAASTLFVSWSSIVLSRPILLVKNQPAPEFGALNRWRAPDALVWAAIVSGGLLLIPDKFLRMVGLNGLLALMTIYFFQGIAIVSWFFETKRVPRGFRVLFYCLIGIQQLFLLIVIGIGFFDLWANFRKLPLPSKTDGTEE